MSADHRLAHLADPSRAGIEGLDDRALCGVVATSLDELEALFGPAYAAALADRAQPCDLCELVAQSWASAA